MTYDFYGWQNADAKPINTLYPFITDPKSLYEALLSCWSADTCAPRMRDKWSEDNPTKGQCSITAFLAQDIFGGKVYGIPLGDGNVHCYNVTEDGCLFDLTSAQFGERAKSLCYENNPEQTREQHFVKQEKRLRYEQLKKRLIEYGQKKGDVICQKSR